VFCEDVVDLPDLSPPIAAEPPPAAPAPPASAKTGHVPTLAEAVAAAERATIADALTIHAGNLSATARALDIDRNTLKRKLAHFGLR
jgi:DNA-binding NtrC family response regulator